MNTIVRPLQTGANVVGGALLLWLAAPLFGVDGRHPFDGVPARLGLLAAVGLLAAASWWALQLWRRHRQSRLETQLVPDSAANDQLGQRFAHAMHLLRSGLAVPGGRRQHWWQRRRMVYQLPWYLFVGAPGAGKTTALLRSGLRFPLAERLGRAPVAGVGGTRQCDWWFTDQAVFIDTAGRYTTQDSHAAGDAHEWQTFLQLLRRQRPAQPVNGVIVTVSVPDLLKGGAELDRQAAAVDLRLQELRRELGQSFPVYLLVTKADLLAGFVEFFGDADGGERAQPWGLTFELDASALVAALPKGLGAQLEELVARVAALTPGRMQQEPLPQRRAAIYAFAAQVRALLPDLERFARQATAHCPQDPVQPVRGLHFSSGTQEGNPIDRVLGELGRQFALARPDPLPSEGGGKAYFLASLLQDLVIAEAPLAGSNLARQRRRRRLFACTAALLASLLLAACAAWWLSYRHNLAYVDGVDQRVRRAMQQVEGRPAGAGLDRLLPLYTVLDDLARGDAAAPAPWRLDFGLFQGPRLAQSAEQTYRQVLDRTLAPLLVARLNEALRQTDDPGARYEALRIGLMLTTPGRLRRAEVRRWAVQAFAAPGSTAAAAPGAGEQQEWLHHLDALLERNAVQAVMRLDDGAVAAARAALADQPFELRVYQRLLARAQAEAAVETTLAQLAGPTAELAFAPPDAAAAATTLPALYTRRVWQELLEPAVGPGIAEVAEESAWVLGSRDPALVRLAAERAEREPVARRIGQRHAQAAIARWDRLLGALALQPPADTASLGGFAAALAAPGSPWRLLMRRVAAEFAPSDRSPASAAGQAYEAALAEHYGALRDYAAGPGPVAVDRLLTQYPVLLQAPNSARAGELARALRAEGAKAPPPFQAVWVALADALGEQHRRALERETGRDLADFAQTCRRLASGRFPFDPEARRDMPLADFARLFGPQGLFEGFFRAHLAAQVDTRPRPWRLQPGSTLPPALLAALPSFELAAELRRVFFAGGAALPQLRLTLTPAAMDDDLLLFSADIDGQVLRYENGPRRPKPVVWPGPGATQKVVMRILPPSPGGVGAEVHEGPWALLRVLRRADAGGGTSARMEVDGRALTVQVALEGAAGASLLGELSRLRCPEAR